MQILVNHEPLSFALESENSLGEVVDGLASWLHKEHFAITAIGVDDLNVPIHDRSDWADRELSGVSTLSIEAFPLDQVQQSTLSALAEYCSLLDAALDSHDIEATLELGKELPYVRSRLRELLPSVATTDEDGGILSDASLDSGTMPGPAEATSLQTQLHGIETLIEARLREYENPERELLLCLGQLVSIRLSLEEVPIQLQTSREALAMATVVRFAELLSRVIRMLPMVTDGGPIDTVSIRQFALDLTPFLQQLQEAFEAQDTVLIGDLLEYEVAPRLSELPRLVPGAGSGDQE